MHPELWDNDSKLKRLGFPWMGTMINEQLSLIEQPESQNDMLKRYQLDL